MKPENDHSEGATFDLLWSMHGDRTVDCPHPGATIRDPSTPAGAISLPNFIVHGEGDDGTDLQVGPILGEGGMGVVYLAHQGSLDRDVAVKQVRGDAPGSASMALIQEARIMGSLEHPNIIPVHSLGIDETGAPTLVMKRVEGDSWGALIGDPTHPGWSSEAGWPDDPIERHVSVLAEVCKGLHFAHGRGILHRDLKPDNIMLGPFGEVYILDWGLACYLEDSESRFRIVGTPAYMAPEMLDSKAPRTIRTDIYLLGSCLYEALTGQAPHTGSSVREVLHAAFGARVPEFKPDAPEELVQITKKAMAPNPADRYPSAAALRKELLAFMRHRGGARLATAALERVARVEVLWAKDPQDEEARALATEALFGLRQAQVGWTANPTARNGLHRLLSCRCTRRMAIGDLVGAREDLEAIQALLPPEEAQSLAPLNAQLHDHLQERIEADPSVSRRQRVLFLLACVTFILMASSLQMESAMRHFVEFDSAWLFQLALVHNVLQGALLLGLRDRLLNTRFNRQVAAIEVATAGTVLINRGMACLMDTAVDAIFVTDMLILSLSVLWCAVYVMRSFAFWAIPLLLGAVLTATIPGYGGEFFTLAAALCGLIMLATMPPALDSD